MNNSVDRFKKRKAILDGQTIPNKSFEHVEARVCVETTIIHSSLALTFKEKSTLISTEAEILLAEIHGKLDEEKISALIEACQKECLQAVIRPFGLAKVLFEDKNGGNVDTIHNVRSGVYATSNEKEKCVSEIQKFNDDKKSYAKYLKDKKAYKAYEDNGKNGPIVAKPVRVPDPKFIYRDGDKRYTDAKSVAKEKLEEGNLLNQCGSGNFDSSDIVHIDHSIPCEKVQNDPARILAEIDGPDLANLPHNLNPMLGHINQSKIDDSAVDAIARWKREEPARLEKIRALENMQESGKIDASQEVHLKKLKQLQELDNDALLNLEKTAQAEIDSSINRKYYKSSKFIKNTAITGLKEGGKMALQQAIGMLMEEFVRAAFFEVREAWQNGFKGSVDDTFLAALKERLMRVAERIQSKWKDAVFAFRDGFISGFLSNIVTVMINTFATMSARVVRIAREGFMSLYHALQMLAFPPEGMSLAQAADAASKLLAVGLDTSGGILLEASFESSLKALGTLVPYVSAITVGLTTGLCTVFAVYLLDQLDIFGVNADSRHGQVVEKLDGMISESYDRALDATLVFDGRLPS